MAWLFRWLHVPASESQKALIIAVCIVAMSVMTIGLIWQAEIIASQRDAIRWLETAKLGG
jgi:hypothetical protein